MSTVLSFSREAEAHARRFISHLAAVAEPPTPELVRLWTMLNRKELSEARLRVAAHVDSLMKNAELQSDDVRMLVGLSYLRLQYLLNVQGAGKDLDALLRDPEQMGVRLRKAFAAIEPDLFAALASASREALSDPSLRQMVAAGCRHLATLSAETVKFDEAAALRAHAFPAEFHEGPSTALALSTLIVMNLWPNKTNTPDPKFPGGGGDGGAPKPK